RSCHLRRKAGCGSPVNNPGPVEVAPYPAGANSRRSDGTAKRREPSDAERAAGSRSASHYRGSGGTKPEGPRGGKEAPEHGTVRGKYGGDIELHDRINETRADSKAGARDAAGGIDDACPSHRYRLVVRGVSAHAQGRSHRRRPANGRRVRKQAGREPPLAA